ncbi:FtsX-like permease family protein [Streptomyces sp. TRM 70361]|uniref:ABC transporter permease n=1 Tax=Streptomyces sp. TRM 70361 TaxID=3116553 RepID=UPI002E7C13A0|nr:FtsX-like permease family protein [Streptomyces sp. TRM 70361]MEE1938550.1 FtsX-like permease family protein [Streptomyces sp. TRM 70361]
MFRTALRNVLAHKARLLMTTLAVMLGVAFVAGTLVFTATLSEAFERSSQKGYEAVDVSVQPDWSTGGGTDGESVDPELALTEDLLEKLREVDGVASAFGTATDTVALAGKDGELVGDGWSTFGNNHAAVDGGKDPRYDLREGRAPRRAGEIALDSRTAERTGYEIGDTVRLSVDGPVREEKVVGVFDTDDGFVAAGGALVLFDTATAQRLFASPGHYSEIILAAEGGVTQTELKERVEEVLPPRTEATTGDELTADQARMVEGQMEGMRTGLLVFAGISLFVGSFIIANTFTMLVAQRTRELALLRAVGAGRRQVTRSVLIEALVVGTVAAAVGLLAGIGIGAGLRALLGALDLTVPDGPLVIPPNAVVAALAVGVLVTVLAAWLPARRAAKIPPVAAMSSVHAAATPRSLVVRNTIGTVLAAGGAALVVAATGMADSEMVMGAGAALTVLGVFVLTPLLSRPLIAASAPLLRGFGVSGRLARLNAARNPRRTAATASALMIGLTLITGLTVIASSVQKSIDNMAAESLRIDYVVSMATPAYLSEEVEKTLEKHEDVTALTPVRPSYVEFGDDYLDLQGVDAGSFGELTSLDFTQGSYEGLGGGKILVDSETADAHGWKTGTSLEAEYEDGERGELTVGGVYRSNEVFYGALIGTADLDPHLGKIESQQIMLSVQGGTSDSAKDALAKALGDNPAIQIQSEQDISDKAAGEIAIMLNILYGLLAMAVIVAVLGVVNTLAMSVFERSQEIGMLRAIGLERLGVKRMVRLESLIISLFGGVLGVGLGVFFGWAAGELLAGPITTYELALPWGRLALFLALAALVGILAALWPARRAARLNMLTAIKTE